MEFFVRSNTPNYPLLTLNSKLPLGFIPESFQFGLVISPVLVDFDEQFQEDFLSRKLFNVSAGLHAEFLDGTATFTDDDGLLRIAGHVNDAADVDAVLGLLITFYLDLYRIWWNLSERATRNLSSRKRMYGWKEP